MIQQNNSVTSAGTKDDSSTNADLNPSAPITPNPMLNAAYQFRQLEWDYFNPYKVETPNKIVAESKFRLPNWMTEKQDCKITICENEFSRPFKIYTAHIWWFNRGVALVSSQDEIKNMNECIELANVRLFELGTLFLGCV